MEFEAKAKKYQSETGRLRLKDKRIGG